MREKVTALIVILTQMVGMVPMRAYGEVLLSERVEAASAVQMITREEGGEVALGKARIVIPAGALKKDTEIRITRLLSVAETGEGLNNATAGGGGYRFEPEGMKFEKEVRLELPYDSKLDGKSGMLEEVQTYYYDTKAKEWKGIEKLGYEEGAGIVTSVTTHFTDFINGTLSLPETAGPIDVNINSIKGLEAADPGSGIGKLEGLEGNSDGSAGFRIRVEVPGGRAGMTPEVAITYSSGGGLGISGKGFDVQYGSQIGVDTRYGAARYGDGGYLGVDRYTLDGVKLEEGGTVSGVTEYRSMKDSARSQIQRVRGGGEDYWVVTEKDGRKKTYGRGGMRGEG